MVRHLTWDQFYQYAHDQFGLDFGNERGAVCGLPTLANFLKMDISRRPFLMENLFRPGELIVLAGARKSSKSYFLLDLLIALATAGKITDRIYSNRSHKVALVDAEFAPEEITARVSQIADLHGGFGDWAEAVTVVSAKHEKRVLDLSEEADQQWLEERIGKAEIAAFDNYEQLVKLGGNYSARWRKVAAWFDRLQERGITVILVHHENRDGELRNSEKIEDDADLVLSLKRPEGWRQPDGNIVEVRVLATRHLHGDQVSPFMIMYGEDDSGFHRAVKQPGEGQASPSRDKAPLVSAAEVKAYELSQLQIEMLEIARKAGRVQAKDVIREDVKGHSPTTVTNAFKELCCKNLLVAQGGSNKGRYYIPILPIRSEESTFDSGDV